MKTIDELLNCIEDDMELLGENRIIYLMEKDGKVLDYDYLPSSQYQEAVTLKNLQDELLLKKQNGMVRSTIKVGMIQMEVTASDAEKNIACAAVLVKEAKQAGAQICVLPECMDLGRGNPRAKQLAKTIPGEISDALCGIAKENGVMLSAGITEKNGDDLYNTALLISEEGMILNKYRKINLLNEEEELYAVGDRLSVTKTSLGKIGLDLGEDNLENSLSIGTTLGRMGADLILSPCTNVNRIDFSSSVYQNEWTTSYQKLARAFSIPVIGVSTATTRKGGDPNDLKDVGASIAVDCDGSICTVLPYGEEDHCVRVAEVHLTKKTIMGKELTDKLARMCR